MYYSGVIATYETFKKQMRDANRLNIATFLRKDQAEQASIKSALTNQTLDFFEESKTISQEDVN